MSAKSRLPREHDLGPAAMARREAIVAVLLRGDRVLAIRRGPAVARPGYWQPLSGKVEPGETQREAVVREVREEVGLTVVPLAKVWESETDDGRFRLHWWTARADTGEVIPDPDEVGEARWVTPQEFLSLDPVFDGDREFFERILPGL
ncbi:NUDIX domain-containing protein [Streptomyces sp. NPDC051243]|uniref:NUDIX domain-containing protein n=1 Tax=Streptomyces sp. NPDC051243 TaxID=3365646 RepID=UPI0037AE07C3